jgi:hypothetical protein
MWRNIEKPVTRQNEVNGKVSSASRTLRNTEHDAPNMTMSLSRTFALLEHMYRVRNTKIPRKNL